MKSCIVSLILLLAVSGSWGILLHPFLLGQPQQHFFYNPPHRNIAQEQFLYFPHLRNPIPLPYQAYNYFPAERNPYNFYNPPAAGRYPLYPNYRETYSPVVQHIYQQAPLQPVPSYTGYGEKVPKPLSKDCDGAMEIRIDPEVVGKGPEEVIMEQIPEQPSVDSMNKQPMEIIGGQISEEITTSSMSEQPKETISLRISEEIVASPTSGQPMDVMREEVSEEVAASMTSEQPKETNNGKMSDEVSANPTIEQPKETNNGKMSDEVSANPTIEQPKETVSEQTSKEDTANLMSLLSESQSLPAPQQEGETVAVQSVEVPEADAASMENSPIKSTTAI